MKLRSHSMILICITVAPFYPHLCDTQLVLLHLFTVYINICHVKGMTRADVEIGAEVYTAC